MQLLCFPDIRIDLWTHGASPGSEKQVVIQESQQSLSKSVIEVCPAGMHSTNLQALVPA